MRSLLMAVLVAGFCMALAGCNRKPCLSSANCASTEVCNGGLCEEDTQIRPLCPGPRCPPPLFGDGGSGVDSGSGAGDGGSTDGGSLGDGGSGTDGGGGGGGDAGAPDAAPFLVSLASTRPTALAFDELGGQLVVAVDDGQAAQNQVDIYPIPFNAASRQRRTLQDATKCDIDLMVNRNDNLYTTCQQPAPALVRVFGLTNGQKKSEPPSGGIVDPRVQALNQSQMVVFSSAQATGGAYWTDPGAATLTARLTPNNADTENIGMALVEDSNGAIKAALTHSMDNPDAQLQLFTFQPDLSFVLTNSTLLVS